jgi:ankyrin repeat protein
LNVHGIDPNFASGILEDAPLHLAAEMGHSAIVELLLAVANIDPDVRGECHDTPLIHACRNGHVSIVQQLLARGDVDVNACGSVYRHTPLIAACDMGHVEIINLLLAKDGINIDLVNGTTPLAAAAGRGLVEVVEYFLARDNLNPNNIGDRNHALGCAASGGYVDVMKLLLDHPDVDPNFARGFHYRDTALVLGARFPDVVKLLLDQRGIDVNHQNYWGHTALYWAAFYNSVESANLLLERDNLNVNISTNTAGGGCAWTALHVACIRGSREVVDLLLMRGDIDPNARDEAWYTPLAYAYSIPIVRSLLSHRDIDPNVRNRDGVTILAHFRESRGSMDGRCADEIESLLLAAGARA